MEAHKDRKHSYCSASGSERWLNCPGSLGLSLECEPQESSDAANEGTRAHELSEKVLNIWKDRGRNLAYSVWARFRPEYVDTECEKTGLSMVDHVSTYVSRCLDEVAFFDNPKECAVAIERQLTLSEDLAMFGTADFLITGNKEGIPSGTVVDLKYGKSKRVKAEGNSQLAYYAVALKKTSSKKLKRVRVVVVQPRVGKKSSFTAVEYSEEELTAWERTLTLGAEKALWQIRMKSQRQFNEGPWCFFCDGKRKCPEVGRKQSDRAVDEFDEWTEEI